MKHWAAMLFCLALIQSVSLNAQVVYRLHVGGPIGPATAEYVVRGIHEAVQADAQCIVIQLDTPGGLLDSTKVIVQEILAAPIPVIVYVAPQGATAASAGCFITLSADVAAMAPATSIGAAHPVSLGGGEGDETMRHKLENYAVGYIESIAARRHRNVEWARMAVKESVSIPGERARELKVIEIIATDMDDLLRLLDGRQIGARTMATRGARVVEVERSPREKFFQVAWRPEVMFILMLIAIYGVIGELSNPGAIFPGVLGAIALVLFLYMSAILPVNAAGLAMVGLAVALFIIDVFAPTHGVLTFGGAVAFFLGAMMMFDRAEPMLRLSLAMVLPGTVLTALFFAFVVGAGLRAQRRPRQVGVETLVGQVVAAVGSISARGGKVFVEGEYWNAVSETPVEEGAPVRIERVEGMVLHVRPQGAVGSHQESS